MAFLKNILFLFYKHILRKKDYCFKPNTVLIYKVSYFIMVYMVIGQVHKLQVKHLFWLYGRPARIDTAQQFTLWFGEGRK